MKKRVMKMIKIEKIDDKNYQIYENLIGKEVTLIGSVTCSRNWFRFEGSTGKSLSDNTSSLVVKFLNKLNGKE
jgi:hypothetical protein